MSFRSDFHWGFATAAAQIEGAGKESELASGRGPSVSCLQVPLIDLGQIL